jgi:P27 family predicted phage terminase small subunit
MKPVLPMSADEKKMFNRIVQWLESNNELQAVDTYMISLCARSWGHIEKAVAMLEENDGKMVQTLKNGTRQVSPEYSNWIRATDEFLKYIKHLGLSPLSRKSLLKDINGGKTDDDPFADLPGTPRP